MPRPSGGIVGVETCTPEVVRITVALPTPIDHVHCYLVRAGRGWILVDTGLGTPDAERSWQGVLSRLDGPLVGIFLTHFHPDHLGAASDLSALTGAPVLQGKVDLAQATRAWGIGGPAAMMDHLIRHGMPAGDAESVRLHDIDLRGLVRFPTRPEAIEPGDDVDGWRVLQLPGHADGHLALLRDGVLVGGDVLLETITPTIGLYPHSVADPLALYLDTLERLERLAPRVVFPGHEQTIHEPARRAQEVRSHHADRLAAVAASIAEAPRTAFEVSLDLFPAALPPVERRFAVAEVIAHAERLVSERRAARTSSLTGVAYVESARA